jgi:hypothetical protein
VRAALAEPRHSSAADNDIAWHTILMARNDRLLSKHLLPPCKTMRADLEILPAAARLAWMAAADIKNGLPTTLSSLLGTADSAFNA